MDAGAGRADLTPGSLVLNASAAAQHRLLDLQQLDAALDLLAHRRRTLPEHAEVVRLDAELARVRDLLVAVETEASDIARETTKAEADVEQVRARARRDQARLDSGQVGSPRELENLQHELVSLGRRQAELEDVELAVMERAESAEARRVELAGIKESLGSERDGVVTRRDEAVGKIDRDAAGKAELRGILAGQVDAPLLALYEKLREQFGGIGAAALAQRRCGGCRMELNVTDLNRIKAAPEDEVLRCEECRRILIRTDESGL